jgi:hypothetical protein
MTGVQIIVAILLAVVFVTLHQVRKVSDKQKKLHKDVLLGLTSIRKKIEADQS